jgi:hypothetical protein
VGNTEKIQKWQTGKLITTMAPWLFVKPKAVGSMHPRGTNLDIPLQHSVTSGTLSATAPGQAK